MRIISNTRQRRAINRIRQLAAFRFNTFEGRETGAPPASALRYQLYHGLLALVKARASIPKGTVAFRLPAAAVTPWGSMNPQARTRHWMRFTNGSEIGG